MFLIVPAQTAPSKKTLPYITFLLIIVNVLVYFMYQFDDWKRIQATVTQYVDSGLPVKERALFEQWKKDNVKEKDRIGDSGNEDDDGDDSDDSNGKEEVPPSLKKRDWVVFLQQKPDFVLARKVLAQPAFDQTVRENAGFQKDEAWQEARRAFEKKRDKISFFRHGFIPGKPTGSGLFTAMFLHGDPMHLLGNMVFLFIFGFALEVALGRSRYLLLYLVSGVLSHAFWWAFSSSLIPGVGASGAISGLMGMYLAVYGISRIRFFYWFLIFFGFFTAPAILMFPVWIGKELWGLLFTDTNINYYAHIGGLIGGFALVMGGRALRILPLNEDYLYEKERAAPFKKALVMLEKAVGELDTGKAIKIAGELLKSHPQDEKVLRLCHALLRSHADNALMVQFVKALLQMPASAVSEELLLNLAEERGHHANKTLLQEPKVLLTLLDRMLSLRHLDPALSLWRELHAKRQPFPNWPKLTLVLGKLAGQKKEKAVLNELTEALVRIYPRSEEAKLLYTYRQHLK
ncbi:MAG: rhomboid family intramembrane serine protease [Burkholderiales bacterium]|jgi:membrane associated rhomboid family serine protease|nr:rhomboid family intramembrane serine protease [Burkholderiales bacterium]